MTTHNCRPVVAFVDDEQMILNALKRSLRPYAKDWDMIFFSSPNDFWQVRVDEWPDVAVLDLTMPGWNGLELAGRLRQAGAHTKCIMLTGDASLDDAMSFINEASVFRYYMKPCAPSVLANAITNALTTSKPQNLSPKKEIKETFPPSDVFLADRLSIGTMVLDKEFCVIFVNKIGLRILREKSTLFRDPSGRLKANELRDGRNLDNALFAVRHTGLTETLALPGHNTGNQLHLTICGSVTSDQIIIFFSDPELTSYPTARTLAKLFRLTGSESRLAEQIVRGLSLEEAAEHNGLRISSARTYLKAIFLKVGVVRQAELVQRILSSSAAIVGDDEL